MGNPFRTFLKAKNVWCCSTCSTHLTSHELIVSKHFQGQHGRGYLFAKAVNITLGKEERRELSTGLHVVADVFCCGCGENIGWKYIKAYVPDEAYKVEKVLLERERIDKDNWAQSYTAQEKEIVAYFRTSFGL